jgi:hypothetical protein
LLALDMARKLRRVDDAGALLAAVTAWGRERSDVRAVLLVGSQARAPTLLPTIGRTPILSW